MSVRQVRNAIGENVIFSAAIYDRLLIFFVKITLSKDRIVTIYLFRQSIGYDTKDVYIYFICIYQKDKEHIIFYLKLSFFRLLSQLICGEDSYDFWESTLHSIMSVYFAHISLFCSYASSRRGAVLLLSRNQINHNKKTACLNCYP